MSAAANKYIRQALHHTETPPPINARFFYASPVPIDDPLSPLPPPNTSSSASSKQPPKPFSAYDNAALDKAWLALRGKIAEYKAQQQQDEQNRTKSRERSRSEATARRDGRADSSESRPATPRGKPIRPAASSLSQAGGTPFSSSSPQEFAAGSPDVLDASALNPDAASVPDTTGTPFLRAPSRKKVNTLRTDEYAARPPSQARDGSGVGVGGGASPRQGESPAPSGDRKLVNEKGPSTTVAVGVSRLHQVQMPGLEMTPIYWTPVHDEAPVVRGTWFYQDTMLPVEPQVAVMLEAGYVDLRCWTDTWKDELNSAVEAGAAGEEKIVHHIWPEKPVKPVDTRPGSSRKAPREGESLLGIATSNLIEETQPETPEQIREKAVEAASGLIDIASGKNGADNKAAGNMLFGRAGAVRSYVSWGVLYANEREARILKPSLMPSAYYGRRPLANYIRKGYKLGIPVVRGFDQAVWDKLYPPKSGTKQERAERGVATSSSGAPPNRRMKSDPNLAKAERPQVTDLILVIHGIGQKLSQRMESFHFTHAINAFRREVNVEVSNKELKARFRKDMGNIMVLPINWRHSLSFEEGGYRDGAEDAGINEFSLKDITPHTLPSVRNIVSDVMLDIPYYMSHHQPKMIAAVIKEANHVYQLWCKNNPGFADSGRVHIIAHSLGSVMAVDILSRQPTVVPKHLSDPTTLDLETEELDHFLFNTANLYLAGSPAGFFLLLKKAQLLPRIDHPSAAALDDPLSNNISVCGERGQYGCIAVDNLYNIINPYDPVAYRMNAAVDAAYSASLKQAVIPSATPGWFGVGTKSAATALFGSGSAQKPTSDPTTTPTTQPPPSSLPRLPSTVELETHNFSREELAEKRMFLLNDNGQLDYFLRYGGGAFEIQYLTMLGAHSSYWLIGDFVRMVVTETGRQMGREGTFLGMRAVKRRKSPGGAA